MGMIPTLPCLQHMGHHKMQNFCLHRSADICEGPDTSDCLGLSQALHANISDHISVPATGLLDFQLWSFAPRLESGWAFLGEALSKWVAVSPQRFASIVDDAASGPTVSIVGVPGEIVSVAYVPPKTLEIAAVDCVIDASGKATFNAVSHSCK
eukprot:m.726103 g.726103  ORF g.726103 m.726103 type:complete len:153 (-) comp23028_c0_seq54:438-896(-)